MRNFLSDVAIRVGMILTALTIIAAFPVEPSEPAANAVPVLSTGALFTDADGNTVAIPEGLPIQTTPVICWKFSDAPEGVGMPCVPEEAPDGTHVVDWVDNSPVYGRESGDSDWMLLVNDSTNVASWEYIGPTGLNV